MKDDPEDVKKQLEAIAGRELHVEAAQLKFLWYPAGVYDYSDGYVALQNVILPGLRCNAARLLDASGASQTGPDGKQVFRLSEFVCLPQQRLLSEPVNVLATVHSTSPFFVTTTHSLIDQNDILRSDLEITVCGWDSNGAPAPNLAFHWRCRVHSATSIL